MTNNLVQFAGGVMVEQHDFSRRTNVKLPAYNEGDPVEVNENGDPVVVLDVDGNPVTPQGGAPASGEGHEGATPASSLTVDEDGDLVDVDNHVIANKGEFSVDENGNPVLDSEGKPVLVPAAQ